MTPELAIYLVQILNLFAFLTMAPWLVVPRLRALTPVDALIALVSVDLGSTPAFQISTSQAAGIKVLDAFRDHIVAGDLAGWLVAIIILVCLRYRARLSVPLIRLVIAETVFILAPALSRGSRRA